MKSIILTPHELQAANEGRLTIIVRPMKDQPKMTMVYDCGLKERWYWTKRTWSFYEVDHGAWSIYAPYKTGETAWVKEKFWQSGYSYNAAHPESGCNDPKFCWTTFQIAYCATDTKPPHCFVRPSIHMPQWASRYEITFGDVEGKMAKDFTFENGIALDIVSTKWWRDCKGYDMPQGLCLENSTDMNRAWESYMSEALRDMLKEEYKAEPDTWLWLWKVEVKRV